MYPPTIFCNDSRLPSMSVSLGCFPGSTISIFINFSFLICAVFLALCSILPHIKGIVNDICDNKCNKHKADFGGNYCVEYDGNTKPPVWLVWGGVSKGITLRRNPNIPTQGNVAAYVRLFSCTAMNDADYLFLFFF